MLPPPSRAPKSGRAVNPRAKALVLDEDEWASQLEAIIERDFFPDVPKLQSKLEWLQVGLRVTAAVYSDLSAEVPQQRQHTSRFVSFLVSSF